MGEYRDSDIIENEEPESVSIPAKIIRETEKAVLIQFCNRDVWLPKSQIFERQEGKLRISKWIYDQKVDEIIK